MRSDIWQYLGLEFVSINVYAKFNQNIPHGSRDRTSFTFQKFHLDRASTDEFVNINEYAEFYQNIPYGSRDRASFTFSEFGPGKVLTNEI